jgi:hypothetical protein
MLPSQKAYPVKLDRYFVAREDCCFHSYLTILQI